VLQVINADGRVIAASSQLQGSKVLLGAPNSNRRVIHDVRGLPDGAWLAEAIPATIRGQAATVIVLTSVEESEHSAVVLRNALMIIVPALVGLVCLLVWVVVGRSLRPVELMRAEVAKITARHLDRRVPTPVANDEIARLSHTLNDMLDRLQVATDAQRRFVADASHELRTPVANIRTALEVALQHPEAAPWPAVAANVLRQDARMERLTDDLLLSARADAGVLQIRLAPVELASLITHEVESRVTNGVVLQFDSDLPSVTIDADVDYLSRVLSNLIDNALQHATNRVTVGLTATPTCIDITVVDDGPGIASADRDAIFDPFVRLDGHRARESGGTGLGLTIVRQLIRAHHGTVSIGDTNTGSSFIIHLPRTATSHT
jgi:signal transduction histidine kinase